MFNRNNQSRKNNKSTTILIVILTFLASNFSLNKDVEWIVVVMLECSSKEIESDPRIFDSPSGMIDWYLLLDILLHPVHP